jgi:hypothetical protein
MMRKFLMLTAAMAALAVPSVAVTSSAEAGAHHRFYGHYRAYRSFAPWYAPRYGYAAPYRYYDRFGSNLNPDRQMVGIGE